MSAKLIDDFCAFYHEYNAISRPRRIMQRRVLTDFALSLDHELEDLTVQDVQDFLATAVADGLKPTTVQTYLKAIRPFLTWLWERQVIDAETLMQVRAVRPPRGAYGNGKPNPYKRPEIERFWRDVDDAYPWAWDGGSDTKHPRRRADRERGAWYFKRWQKGHSPWLRAAPYCSRLQVEAIASLALFGGLRRDEAYILGVEDAHPENDYIAVTGAAKNPAAEPRPREVPWTSDYLRAAMGAWIDARDALAPAHDVLWLSLYGSYRARPLAHRRYEMLLRNIGRGYEFRRMRHTCATELLRHGYPLEVVSKLLGHARLQQTLAYAELLGVDLERHASRHRSNVDSHLAPAVPTKAAA